MALWRHICFLQVAGQQKSGPATPDYGVAPYRIKLPQRNIFVFGVIRNKIFLSRIPDNNRVSLQYGNYFFANTKKRLTLVLRHTVRFT